MGRFDAQINKFREDSKWLRLKDGEKLKGIFVNVSTGPSNFGKETLSIVIEISGKQKIFQTTARKAYIFFNDFPSGKEIEISREGTGMNTRYSFRDVSMEGNPV